MAVKSLAERWLRDARSRFGMRAYPVDGNWWQVKFSDGEAIITENEFQEMAREVERLK